MAGLDPGDLARYERPLPGNCAALPQRGHCLNHSAMEIFAAPASGRFVRTAVIFDLSVKGNSGLVRLVGRVDLRGCLPRHRAGPYCDGGNC